MKCPNCHADVGADQEHCPNCGHRLDFGDRLKNAAHVSGKFLFGNPFPRSIALALSIVGAIATGIMAGCGLYAGFTGGQDLSGIAAVFGVLMLVFFFILLFDIRRRWKRKD